MKNIFHKACSVLHQKLYGFTCYKYPKFNDGQFMKWLDDNRLSMKICKDCMDFCNDKSDMVEICSAWHSIFYDVCYLLDINKRGADTLWNFGEDCNWQHLWISDKEKQMSLNDWYNFFKSEVFYCSDRWSIERLLRTHWSFWRWHDKAKKNK